MSHHHHKIQMFSGSDLYSTKPDFSGLTNKINSVVFEGKSPFDYESAWSPTSPLDFRLFSSLGNPFGRSSSKSIRKMHQKSWDSGKVGLSIVDSLDDHSSTILLPSPDSKNIIFGSLMMRTKCHKPHLPNPVVDDKPNVDLIALIDTTSCSVNACCSGVENIGVNNNAGQVMKQPSQRSLNEHTESDIEISEDYTCVISHGPNPKTTHFYGDQVLDSLEHNRCGKKEESIFEIAPLEFTTVTDELLYDGFLSFCCSCSKKLGIGKDIYMYRGYKAFCSSECRAEVIHLDEETEEEEDEAAKSDGSFSDKELSKKKKSHGVIFTVG